jgi:hypothetical protein
MFTPSPLAGEGFVVSSAERLGWGENSELFGGTK